MRKRFLIWIAACFYYSGLVKLVRWWTRYKTRSLIVLNYHSATGGDLRRHLLYLRKHYRVLHLEGALEELYASSNRQEDNTDLRTSLVLTFDDGYRDNYTHGFALARELQIPMTIFLIPGYIESGDSFWWLEGKRLVSRTQVDKITVNDHIYHLDQPGERRLLVQTIDSHLRHVHSVSERERFLESIREAMAVSSSVVPEEEATHPFGWSEVQEMEASGWISFGAHTMHHPILSYLTNPTEMEREVGECRTVLEQKLGHKVRTFAYPVGQRQHIGEDVLRAVRQAGYGWAFTTTYGYNTPNSNPYLLRRIEVDVSQHWLVMAAETAGLWGFFSRLRWLPFVRKHFTDASS